VNSRQARRRIPTSATPNSHIGAAAGLTIPLALWPARGEQALRRPGIAALGEERTIPLRQHAIVTIGIAIDSSRLLRRLAR